MAYVLYMGMCVHTCAFAVPLLAFPALMRSVAVRFVCVGVGVCIHVRLGVIYLNMNYACTCVYVWLYVIFPVVDIHYTCTYVYVCLNVIRPVVAVRFVLLCSLSLSLFPFIFFVPFHYLCALALS